LYLLRFIAMRRLSTLAERTETRWDDGAVQVLKRTNALFLLLVALFAGATLVQLPEGLRTTLNQFLVIALIVQGGIWINAAIGFWLRQDLERRRRHDPGSVATVGALSFVGRVALWSLVALLVLDNLGIDVTALVAGLGIGGVAVALAVQNILGDLFASLSIALDKPFAVGDFLIVGDLMGAVEHIGLKTTRLRSLSGEQLIFANTDLLGSRVRNYGRMQERRVAFTLGLTYQTPRAALQRIPAMVEQAITEQQLVRFDRSHFRGYGDFALEFENVYYVLSADYNVYMDIQQAINLRIHQLFEEAGIEFAYPTQTLFVNAQHRVGQEATVTD
jgi:small-conductance mechanosensitive channel